MSPSKVLVVDDHADTARVFCRVLRMMGCEPTIARSGAEALAHARKARFDVLMADIGLPDMDGRDLLAEIRSLYPVAAIAVTGVGRANDIAGDLAVGVAEHLTKPVGIRDIQDAVRRALEAGGGAPPGRDPTYAPA